MFQRQPIFIVTGAPGAGKSSVAAALMRRFPRGLHLPVDDLREMVVSGIAHPVPEWTDETGRQFALARRAAARVARIYAEAGFAVAIDDVIGPAEARSLLVEPLADYPVRKILLRPSVAIALERNAARLNKQFDTAVLEGAIRFAHESADLAEFAAHDWRIVDSTELTLDETVDIILAEDATSAPPAQPVDQRGVLEAEVFSYRASKDKLFIYWHGKQVMILKGQQASKFLAKLETLDGKVAQLAMAKITGNFKHGNERRNAER